MMRNIYQSSQFNDKNVFWEKKNFFGEISAVRRDVCAYTDSTFLCID